MLASAIATAGIRNAPTAPAHAFCTFPAPTARPRTAPRAAPTTIAATLHDQKAAVTAAPATAPSSVQSVLCDGLPGVVPTGICPVCPGNGLSSRRLRRAAP